MNQEALDLLYREYMDAEVHVHSLKNQKRAILNGNREGSERAEALRPQIEAAQRKANEALKVYESLKTGGQSGLPRAIFDRLTNEKKSLFIQAGGRLTD